MGLVATRPPVIHGPRTVRLLPTPRNVEIKIGDGEFRAWGPGFTEVELSPGRYHIQMRGSCCEEADFSFVVPPGPPNEPVSLQRQLRFKPAQLYVVSNVEGEVRVNGERVGNTHTFIPVPMERLEEQVQISVTSPGYRAYTATRTLTAGGATDLRNVTLEEASGSSP